MTAKDKAQQAALQAYAKRRQSIDDLMNQIRAKLESADQDEGINWAHVGSMGHAEEILSELNEFLG